MDVLGGILVNGGFEKDPVNTSQLISTDEMDLKIVDIEQSIHSWYPVR